MREVSEEYNFYVDVFFAVNFTMDYLMLSITAKGFSYESSRLRRIAAALLGAVWAVAVAAFPGIPVWFKLPVTFLVIPVSMVRISYVLKGAGEWGRAAAALYLVTALAAGVMEALYRNTMAGWYFEQLLRGNETAAVPLVILALFAAGTYFGLKGGVAWMKAYQKEKSHYYEVTIHYKGKEKTITALLDTGNRLYEPVTHSPVHVVTYEAVKEICSEVSGVTYIPFGSVGKEHGVLPGIYLDRMEIRQGRNVRVVDRPLVAVFQKPLSAEGRYQMLLHEI